MMDDNNNNDNGFGWLGACFMICFLVIFLPLAFFNGEVTTTSGTDVTPQVSGSAIVENKDSIKNTAKEGTYYVVNIENLSYKDEMYVTVCTLDKGRVNYYNRYIFNIVKEPELSKWHTLMVGDIINYKGSLDFEIQNNQFLDNGVY